MDIPKLSANDINSVISDLKDSGEIRTKDISDGYHTFGELYDDRAVLFLRVLKDHPELSWKSKFHHDGTMFGDPGEMFIVGIDTPEGQYTYHYHMDPYWDEYSEIREVDSAPEWDGHTREDVRRLLSLS